MEYDAGDGPQETWVYVEPPVATFYRNSDNNNSSSVLSIQQPAFRGRHCKFFNLLNVPLKLYWEKENGTKLLVKVLRPLSTAGITAFVDNVFSLQLNDTVVLERFQVRSDFSNVFSIDPHVVDKMNKYYGLPPMVTQDEKSSYTWLIQTLTFHTYYSKWTGRSFLSRYGKLPPKHFMWPADFMGQKHYPVVTSKDNNHNDNNMTLTVLSCAPRVFEIRDFLSVSEVQHIIELAERKELMQSQIGDATQRHANDNDYASQGTRSSQNSWIFPDESPIIQSIYRRAYHLLQLDHVSDDITEPLQMVRYRASEAYKVHADFGYPDPSHPQQPTRFATLLLYLNNVTLGGETSFPLWSNAETNEALRVRPEQGKAVLFYSMVRTNQQNKLSEHSTDDSFFVIMMMMMMIRRRMEIWTKSPCMKHCP